jgi:hypothetical protein
MDNMTGKLYNLCILNLELKFYKKKIYSGIITSNILCTDFCYPVLGPLVYLAPKSFKWPLSERI